MTYNKSMEGKEADLNKTFAAAEAGDKMKITLRFDRVNIDRDSFIEEGARSAAEADNLLLEVVDGALPINFRDIMGNWLDLPAEYQQEAMGPTEQAGHDIYTLMLMDIQSFLVDQAMEIIRNWND